VALAKVVKYAEIPKGKREEGGGCGRRKISIKRKEDSG